MALLLCITAYPQRGNNWVFGGNACINFSTTPPTAGVSAMFQQEGSSSISDLNGNLLFYSDGIKVWNAQQQVMPNGTGLHGHVSSTQSSMIVPFPADPKRYYLFTMDGIGGPRGLSYSVVNMDLDNGNGDIEIKNTFLIGPSSEKVTSVNHCNGKDVWVVTATATADKFYAYLITAGGINAPVVSTIGAPLPYFNIGYLKLSPDGTKLGCANLGRGLDLFDFDDATGLINNRKKILSGSNQHTYGIEFSPNSKLMYVANIVRVNNVGSRFDVSQYARLNESEAAIFATRYELDTFLMPSVAVGFALFNAIQLGPDGKVHVSSFVNGLHIVPDPDRVGVACNYSRTGIPLAPGTSTAYGLPDFNQSYFKGSFQYDISCTDNRVKFYFTKQAHASGIKWDFGDPGSGADNASTLDSPLHVFSNPGVYEVKVISFLPCRNDTLKRTITVGPLRVSLGPDRSICGAAPQQLSPEVLQGQADSYVWQNNSTAAELTASANGLYWVEIKNLTTGCSARDSIELVYKPYPVLRLGNDTSICEGTTHRLDAGNAGAVYSWQDNSQGQIFNVTRAGLYSVKVDLEGCIGTDSITIGTKYYPIVKLGNDTTICDGMTISLIPT
ncbi:MAG: hypothetical protein EOP51_25210, partial [Sphingobacteriales bacterium]